MTIRIAPSILAADFAALGRDVDDVLRGGADWIHVDVMDGQFVPNITMGTNVVEALRRQFDCFLDVHLMVVQPERYIDAFAKAGANCITVHAEATPHIHRALQQIRAHGIMAGLALNPGTGLDLLPSVADLLDLLLLMTVNPGFGGQKYITAMTGKIEAAKARLQDLGHTDVVIEVDGGIAQDTIAIAAAAGADTFVAGSAIFSETDRTERITILRNLAEHGASN